MFGISKKSFQLIISTLQEFPEIQEASVYGSRAMGNFKNGSDIDMVIFGKDINLQILLSLKTKLEQELPIPYFFDITHYESISNEELKNHIDKNSKRLYSRDQNIQD